MKEIMACWTAPAGVTALTTTRFGGVSQSPYDSNNLALHVGDVERHVRKNRLLLKESYQLPSDPIWLNQTHSNRCVVVDEEKERNADAAITRCKNTVLAIMTADCLPIVLCDGQGEEIAAIHAGWKGLAHGIIENTLRKMRHKSGLTAWIGPAICGCCFEVGEEVKTIYLSQYPFAEMAFQPCGKKWLANLPVLAERILNTSNVSSVHQAQMCTFEQKKTFFSYRRELQTGRMATLIWFKQD